MPIPRLDVDESAPLLVLPNRRPLLDRRARGLLAAAAAAAVLVNAGVVWAYWTATSTSTDMVPAGSFVSMALRGRSSLDVPLRPGSTGALTVTVTNDNSHQVVITSVRPGPGNVVADAEHREAGCVRTGVALTRPSTAVRWEVAANNVAVFTVRDGLRMADDADPSCAGAVFTVPVQVTGEAGRG